MMSDRNMVLREVASRIMAVRLDHPVRVAVDRRCAAGKTTLAAEVARLVRGRGREVLQAGLDDYRLPWAQRNPAERDTGEGLYRRAWQLDAVRVELLLPLGPGSSRECVVRAADADGGQVQEHHVVVDQDVVVIVDGVFALRPELNDFWDFRVHVDVDPEHTLQRGPVRELTREPNVATVPLGYHSRYLPSEEIYLREVRPVTLADVIVDNRDLDNPQLTWRLVGGDCAR